jgi:hypothetical protein
MKTQLELRVEQLERRVGLMEAALWWGSVVEPQQETVILLDPAEDVKQKEDPYP